MSYSAIQLAPFLVATKTAQTKIAPSLEAEPICASMNYQSQFSCGQSLTRARAHSAEMFTICGLKLAQKPKVANCVCSNNNNNNNIWPPSTCCLSPAHWIQSAGLSNGSTTISVVANAA